MNIQPIILAGGSGTRLWPLSRAQYPKQFLVLQGDRSLFQQAVQRLSSPQAPDIVVASPCVIGNDQHRFLILEQLRELEFAPASVVLEPIGRNTAPALTLAALHAHDSGNDPILVVGPADQTVTDEAAFTAALQRAVRVADSGSIVILGITPDRPETGFGYIRSADAPDALGAERVAEFVEKPDLATARRYVEDGHYHWNSGLFVVRASVWLAAIERFRPDIAAASREAWATKTVDGSFIRPDPKAFAAIPAESVDYAVMEKCAGPGAGNRAAGDAEPFDIRMVRLAAGWSDLGAWDAVWQVSPKDDDGNASVGDTMMSQARNTLVHATSRLVGVVGVKDVIVVETADAVLVADRSQSQNVRQLVDELHRAKRSEHTLHRQVHRPWGWYDSIDSGPRFQVKRIMVKPGASLSLQMHHHRAEHWIVVSGTAEVTNGDQVILLTENQSTYIPLGTTHRLANPGKVPLEIIEVQSGSYLGEDDIVRFDDVYGRGR